jgi:hypothetical protein
VSYAQPPRPGVYSPEGPRFAIAALIAIAFLPAFLLVGFTVDMPVKVVGLTVLVVLFGLLIYRSFRVSLSIEEQGIAVSNYFRSYQIAWEDVRSIQLSSASALAEGMEGIEIVTRSAGHVFVQASLSKKRRDMLRDLSQYGKKKGFELNIPASAFQRDIFERLLGRQRVD